MVLVSASLSPRSDRAAERGSAYYCAARARPPCPLHGGGAGAPGIASQRQEGGEWRLAATPPCRAPGRPRTGTGRRQTAAGPGRGTAILISSYSDRSLQLQGLAARLFFLLLTCSGLFANSDEFLWIRKESLLRATTHGIDKLDEEFIREGPGRLS
jgi:hypothetical protein